MFPFAAVGAEESAADQARSAAEDVRENAEALSEEGQRLFMNGWRAGKIETAFLFSDDLNNFEIDVDVDGDTVRLDGTVSTPIEKELAGEIARNTEGIQHVQNELRVSDTAAAENRAEDNAFLTAVRDAWTTAKIKTQLLANDSIGGMAIDVDTQDKVVTLRGTVPSQQARDLAEDIAASTGDVESVANLLEVVS